MPRIKKMKWTPVKKLAPWAVAEFSDAVEALGARATDDAINRLAYDYTVWITNDNPDICWDCVYYLDDVRGRTDGCSDDTNMRDGADMATDHYVMEFQVLGWKIREDMRIRALL